MSSNLTLSDNIFSIISAIVCIVVLSAYTTYIIFCCALGRSDQRIQLRRNIDNALIWVDKHASKPDAPNVTLAIQTLRNTILVAIFIGGASFQFAFNILSTENESTDMIKEFRNLVIAAYLFCSFLNWAFVIRCASHLGYRIGLSDTINSSTNPIGNAAINNAAYELQNTVENLEVISDVPTVISECRNLTRLLTVHFRLLL